MLFEKINLQLFAEMNVNTTLSADLSVENKTFYDKTLLVEAQPLLVHDQFAQKRPIPKNGGKEIEFRKFASLDKATEPLTEGVTPNGKNLKVTSMKATVSQYGDYVVYSDILDLTAIDPVVTEAVKVIGNQAGLTLDTITREALQRGTNVFYCSKANGDVVDSRAGLDNTCKLTAKEVKRVVAWLKKNNAPKIDGSYVAIIHPYVAYDLQNDPEWIEAHKYTTPENIYEGELGKIGGVRFVESSEAKMYEGGVFGCIFLGANAYGVTEVEGGGLRTIIKQLGSSGVSDALDQRASIGWKAIKTAEILIENYIVRLECKSELSEAEMVEN
jgi:N4-gp56 family major capsid protein